MVCHPLQDFFKKALEWMADHETRNGKPQSAVGYMSLHQHDINAMPLWTYFQSVLRWAMDTFNMKKFKKIMKGLDWAKFYDEYHETSLYPNDMQHNWSWRNASWHRSQMGLHRRHSLFLAHSKACRQYL